MYAMPPAGPFFRRVLSFYGAKERISILLVRFWGEKTEGLDSFFFFDNMEISLGRYFPGKSGKNIFPPKPLGKTGVTGKTNMKGFTLIELLVVILIIGILVGAAVPQYQKTVAKARLARFEVQARSLRESLRMFALANGTPARRISDLDLWDRVDSVSDGGSECGNLGTRRYCDVGGHYIQTYFTLPGYQTWYCHFHWEGR